MSGATEAGATPGRLVEAAATGDSPAWNALVTRFASLVWSIARSYRLDPADAADVSQTTWLRLVEHLDRIRDPDRVGAWLAATARNESLRVLRRAGREVPDDGSGLDGLSPAEDSPEAVLLRSERRRIVHHALLRLSQRCQTLLRALSASPDTSYSEVSEALGMPMGSIGPTRARCLDRLRLLLTEGEDGMTAEMAAGG